MIEYDFVVNGWGWIWRHGVSPEFVDLSVPVVLFQPFEGWVSYKTAVDVNGRYTLLNWEFAS